MTALAKQRQNEENIGMEIHNESIHQQAMTVLRSLYGEGAKFRSGQYEAIEATMLHRRTLVVQRTG